MLPTNAAETKSTWVVCGDPYSERILMNVYDSKRMAEVQISF
jgi:hypothetical protein|tara:strand:- start:478 stop:603 length:126 start_codon:yes stop_codon:yes gene_type:complete